MPPAGDPPGADRSAEVSDEPGVAALVRAAAHADRAAARERVGRLGDAALLGVVIDVARLAVLPRDRGRRRAGIDALAGTERARAELGLRPRPLDGDADGLASWAIAAAPRAEGLLAASLDLTARPWVMGLVASWLTGERLRAVAALVDGRVVGVSVPDLRPGGPEPEVAGIHAASVGRAPRDVGADAALALTLRRALGLRVPVESPSGSGAGEALGQA